MPIDYPPVFINNYLAEKITEGLPEYFNADPQAESEYPLRFFPTQPTSIDTLTEEFPEASENVFAVYDRMFRMRRGPFPHCRTEQLLYYFYKTSGGIDALIETTQEVARLLDDGDESAEDVNVWIKEKLISSPGNYVTRQKIPVFSRSLTNNIAELTTNTSHGLSIGDKVIVSGVGTAFDSGPQESFEVLGIDYPVWTKITDENDEDYNKTILTEPAKIRYQKTNIDIAEFNTTTGAYVGIAHPTVKFGSGGAAKDFFLPKFQEFKIYQLEEARDIIDFGTARTYAGNKIIIEYVWHKSAPIKR
jgi:hypothetical protein